MLFDKSYYIDINNARWNITKKILDEVRDNKQNIDTCIDIGCGPGWFSKKLLDWGLAVHGIDGRLELIYEAKRRVPNAKFSHINIESNMEVSQLTSEDLILCFGILYHTENPFRVIRNLETLTKKILFIESMIIPESKPILWLVEENKNETQGLTRYAMIPSQTCMIKMLQTSGFEYVYKYLGNVDHEDFIESDTKYKRRGIFIASRVNLKVKDLVLVPDIPTPKYDFSKKI